MKISKLTFSGTLSGDCLQEKTQMKSHQANRVSFGCAQTVIKQTELFEKLLGSSSESVRKNAGVWASSVVDMMEFHKKVIATTPLKEALEKLSSDIRLVCVPVQDLPGIFKLGIGKTSVYVNPFVAKTNDMVAKNTVNKLIAGIDTLV